MHAREKLQYISDNIEKFYVLYFFHDCIYYLTFEEFEILLE